MITVILPSGVTINKSYRERDERGDDQTTMKEANAAHERIEVRKINMNNQRSKPDQVSSGGIMITHFPDANDFQIALRERVREDGLVQGTRGISIDPVRIAFGEDPVGFVRLLKLMIDDINNLTTKKDKQT